MSTLYGPILIVEDVPNVLELLEVTLRFKGYAVLTARNGEEALEVIARQRPVLIITDILMPKLDGYAFVQKLRLNPETRPIPVVFLSATYVTPEDALICQPEMSTASVVEGLYSSRYSSLPVAVAGCGWISLITTLGLALWLVGTSVALVSAAIWVRRSFTPSSTFVIRLDSVAPPHLFLSSTRSASLPAVSWLKRVWKPVPVRYWSCSGPQPAEVHLLDLGDLEEGLVQLVAGDVGGDEVTLGVAATGEDAVQVPAQDLPAAGAAGVPEDVEVLAARVPVPELDRGGQVLDHLGHVDVGPDPGRLGGRRAPGSASA